MRTRFALLAVMASVLSGPVAAGQCGFAFCWGAVAVGPNGAWGYAHSQTTEDRAVGNLQRACEGDCDNLHTFYNSCGAIAEDAQGNWGFGRGDSRIFAEQAALSFCGRYGQGCQIRVWACSP